MGMLQEGGGTIPKDRGQGGERPHLEEQIEQMTRELGRMSHEELWALTAEEFTRRAGKTLKVSETFRVYEQTHEETLSVSPIPCPLPEGHRDGVRGPSAGTARG